MRFRETIFWNAISQFGQYGIQFISIVVLARLLTPDDFGIVGMVAIFIALSQIIADSEMGGALLRKKEVDRLDYSTLFWYNLAVSIIIYLLLYVTSPLIAKFYNRPELSEIIRILSISIIINAFKISQRVIMLRNLQFRLMAIINIGAGSISLAVAIWMARTEWGYWALIGQQLTKSLLDLIFMQFNNRFIPLPVFSISSFRYQFSFGFSLLTSDIIKTTANNISTNIIAKLSSLQFTGFYTQTSRITGFSQSLLGAVMDQSVFPMMARMDKKEQIVSIYHRLMKYIVLSGIPTTIILVVFSGRIIQIILGEEWLEATWIFQVLSITILPVSIQMLCRNILKVINATKLVLALETIKSILVVSSLFAAIVFGSVGIVWAFVIAQIISAVLQLFYTAKALELRNL